MNFYKYTKNQCLHNKGYQVAYIIEYICFMYFKNNNKIDGNQKQKYFDAKKIDYSAANKLVTEDFLFDSNDFKYLGRLMQYILLNILNTYFSQVLNKQKIRHQNGCYLSKYIKQQALL